MDRGVSCALHLSARGGGEARVRGLLPGAAPAGDIGPEPRDWVDIKQR